MAQILSEEMIAKHPLTIERRAFYQTWYGKLTRADGFQSAFVGSVILSSLLGWVISLSQVNFYRDPRMWSLVLTGFAWGTLYEYLNHRFLFHRLVKVKGFRSFEKVHLPHHIDLEEGVNAGPLSYLPVFFAWFLVMSLLLRSFTHASAFIIGMTVWFVWYELQHDYDHFTRQDLRKKIPNFKFMSAWHLVHHYHPERNFGITSPFWDFVLRTSR